VRRYQFRLGRVLRVRRIQEEQLRGAWLEARARADAARAAEQAQQSELARARVELERMQAAGPLDPRAVVTQQDLYARAERELGRRAGHARALEAEAARRADLLREARTAVRGLERLDERRRRAHTEEATRREQAQTDEVAARRFSAEAEPASDRARAALEAVPSSPGRTAADESVGGLPRPRPAS